MNKNHYLRLIFKSMAVNISKKPNKNINLFNHFLVPRTLGLKNKSKSAEPTKAPENALESPEVKRETVITAKLQIMSKIVQTIRKTSPEKI